MAQERTVSGRVTSAEDGSAAPGVNVIVKGTTQGTATNASGDFSIGVPNSESVLVFSFIGFKTQEVKVGNQTNITVSMELDATQLTEVVVTGYNTQNKREISGSVSTVKGEVVERVPLASFDQALQGQFAGVLVTANSGQPGAPAQVRIRGTGSITGGNTPLFIMDGVEITAADFATLNPADFETYSVLKDAIATSQYGSRGAAGVIVVTTKKGRSAIPKLTYDVQYGFSRAPENRLQVMTSSQKLDYELANGNPFGWTDDDVARLRQINTNWEDVFFQTGKTVSHTLNLSGATGRTNYFISGSAFDQTGTVQTTGLKRYTGRVNVESGTGGLTFGINSTFGYSEFANTSEDNTALATPLNAIRWINPYETPYDEDGNYTQMASGQPNALQELLENPYQRQQLKAVGNIYASYDVPFLKGLTLKTSWGGDFTSNEQQLFLDGTTATGASTPSGKGSFNRNYGKRFRYTGTTSINYSKQIGTDHTVSIGLFNEVVRQTANNFGFTGYGLGGPFENEAGITPGNNTNGFIPQVQFGTSDGVNVAGLNGLLSYFTLINYGFKDRYFLSIAGRRDGSSRFGRNFQYANFGSIGASWIVSDENFMAGLKESIFEELKFKVSYGSAGNQSGIGFVQSRELYSRSVYNGVSGLAQIQLESPDLRWERRTTFNTGIELTTLRGRVNFMAEYYNSLTTDLFLGRPLSRTTGYSTIQTNLGEMQNRGIELSVNAEVIKKGDFSLGLNANFTYNKNTVNKLFAGTDQIITGNTITKEGEMFNSLFLVRYAGVNPENGAAQYLTKDGEITETYNPNDRVIVGSYEAPYYGGFGTTVRFKGLELSALFSYVMGNQIFNNDRNNVENPTYLWDNLSVNMLREWRTPGQITDVPSPNNQYRAGTTRFVEDGDFLRLRNVVLSYSLPKSLLSKARINSLKFYAQGQNLATWTQFLGFDPEITTGMLSGAQYPALRQVTFGATLGF